jgi:hypothetical protein
MAAGATTALAQTADSVALNPWYTLMLEVTGGTRRGDVNGLRPVAATDRTFAAGCAPNTPARPSMTSW